MPLARVLVLGAAARAAPPAGGCIGSIVPAGVSRPVRVCGAAEAGPLTAAACTPSEGNSALPAMPAVNNEKRANCHTLERNPADIKVPPLVFRTMPARWDDCKPEMAKMGAGAGRPRPIWSGPLADGGRRAGGGRAGRPRPIWSGPLADGGRRAGGETPPLRGWIGLGRVFAVQGPCGWIGMNILSDALQFGGSPDNVLVVIALPQRGAGRLTGDIELLRGLIFVIGDDLSQGRAGFPGPRLGCPASC